MVGDDRRDARVADQLPAHLAAAVVLRRHGDRASAGSRIWFHDPRVHQDQADPLLSAWSPSLLLFGLVTERNLLKAVLGTAYPGLSDRGWFLLTRNWVALLPRHGGRSTRWCGARPAPTSGSASKIWGCSCLLTFLFALANIPMLMRHGLDAGGGRRKSRRSRRRNRAKQDADAVISIEGLSKTYATGVRRR